MTKGLSTKTLKWKYIETLEPPRVVKVRTPSLIEQNNYYGQVTVRFHSKQVWCRMNFCHFILISIGYNIGKCETCT